MTRALALAVLVAFSARAAETPPQLALPADAPAPKQEYVKAGDPAPYSGVLLNSSQLTIYLAEQQTRRAQDKSIADLERKLSEASSRSWFDEHKFTLGLVLGVVASGFIAWQAARLAEAARR